MLLVCFQAFLEEDDSSSSSCVTSCSDLSSFTVHNPVPELVVTYWGFPPVVWSEHCRGTTRSAFSRLGFSAVTKGRLTTVVAGA